MRARIAVLVALAALVAVSVVACGGDDDDDSEGSTATIAATGTAGSPGSGSATPTTDEGDDEQSPTSTASSGTSTSTATASATSTATSGSGSGSGGGGSPGSSGGGDDLAEFKGLLEGNEERTYSITYEVVSSEGGSSSTGLWTLAQDPPRSAAIIEADEGRVWVIDDGNESFMCFESGGEGQCLSADQGGIGAPDVVDVDEFSDTAEESTELREISGRTIAGRNARCFEYSGTSDDDSGVMCLDADKGYMLFIETGGAKMTAVEVRDSVPANTFEPPFDVIG